jgi:hypothetical protein
MLKFVIGLIFSVLIGAFALLPEIAMYFTWHLVNPTSELSRIALGGLFWFGGAGLCLVFGFIGLAMWASCMKAILE